ncbi:hypothetical protein AVEN_120107-1 [Araneus ventricosus]|uniref:Uncharacterized protein n=1 Tax=Araneus ventricosus TaxID=182803 RepID=A0A4Y2G502_ARAVE|nr:hypothetical protein AVEN_120107-1 [Araneus ventricosus]
MEGDSSPAIGRIGGPLRLVFMNSSVQQRRSEPIAQRRGSKASPEELCSGVTDVETPQNLLPPKKKLATEKNETDEIKALTTKEL